MQRYNVMYLLYFQTAPQQDRVNDISPIKKINQFEGRLGTKVFKFGQRNEEPNIIKEECLNQICSR